MTPSHLLYGKSLQTGVVLSLYYNITPWAFANQRRSQSRPGHESLAGLASVPR